ncbi:hypothetical protein ZWY2020_059992, partial [Hordeum vulgare]
RLRALAYGADDVLDELDYFRIQDELNGTFETIIVQVSVGPAPQPHRLRPRRRRRAARSKPTVTPDLAKEYDYCVYDSNIATGYGVGALLLLIAAQVIVMLASQCFCCGCGLKPGLLLLFSW